MSDHDHSIENEPHLQAHPAQPDPSETAAEKTLRHATNRDPAQEAARHSVFNEPMVRPTAADSARTPIDRDWSCPTCSYNLRGTHLGDPCPECGHTSLYQPPPLGETSYGTWLNEKRRNTPATTIWSTVVFIALAGGVWAVVGALLTAHLGIWGIVLIGPITEEVMKIAIVTGTIETHPYLFRKPSQIWIAAICSAAVFAIIENVLYLNYYFPEASSALVHWRWTICSSLHIGCTAIATVGITKVWSRSINEMREPNLAPAGPWLIAAAAVHGIYNASAVFMAAAGFDF